MLPAKVMNMLPVLLRLVHGAGEECVDIGQHDTGCHDAAGEVM